MSMLQLERRQSAWVCPALAFVAGFLDAATFVRGGGVFCAHITGNLIVIAANLINGQGIGWLTAATLPMFAFTVALTSALYRKATAQGCEVRALRAIFGFECTALAIACLLGALPSFGDARTWVVLSLVSAMAAQTTLQRLSPQLGAVTTVMTGNLAQCLLDLPVKLKRRAWRTPGCSSHVVALFLCGCALGVLLVQWYGFGTLVVPLFVLWRVGLRGLRPASRPEPSAPPEDDAATLLASQSCI